MRSLMLTISLILFTVITAMAGEGMPEGREPDIRFESAEIFVDSGGEALAAYQVEIRYDRQRVKIIGLEGGETRAFREPPFYDPKGMAGGRIIVAAFTTDDSKAPERKSRVARLHLQVIGKLPVQLTIRLITAAKPGGERIQASANIVLLKNSGSIDSGEGKKEHETFKAREESHE